MRLAIVHAKQEDSTRLINIGQLEGKSNWSTWKYKASICLRGISGALDVVEGRLVEPNVLEPNASVEAQTAYKNASMHGKIF